MSEQQKRLIARKLRQLADDIEKAGSATARSWIDLGAQVEIAGEMVDTSPDRVRWVSIELEVTV